MTLAAAIFCVAVCVLAGRLALRERRAERLSPEHLLMLARMGKDVGCRAILHCHCQEVGYIMPTPIEPRAEAADLQRQYIEASKALIRMSERIERLRSVA